MSATKDTSEQDGHGSAPRELSVLFSHVKHYYVFVRRIAVFLLPDGPTAGTPRNVSPSQFAHVGHLLHQEQNLPSN